MLKDKESKQTTEPLKDGGETVSLKENSKEQQQSQEQEKRKESFKRI